MKSDIILSGVGGQGILSIATTLSAAALNQNYFIKQAETHGMSQRGGAVVSHLRISDREIYSDLIPKGRGDLIMSVEPLEALRYLSYLSPDATVVTNIKKFKNIDDYPELDKFYEKAEKKINIVQIDADKIAREIGNNKASNMVILGAGSPFIDISEEIIIEGIKTIFAKKGQDIIDLNIEAFKAGREFALAK